MYSKNPLCDSAHVYRGFLKSGIFGDQIIAIKYLPQDEQHMKEAKLLHELGSHPNVVTFFYADVHNKGPYPAMYIAMELCQTLNLHDRILKNKKDNVPFDHELSLLHAKQIALGVDFIHKKEIINRDLKPQNVLFSVDGENLKISNFGLSKPLRHGRSMTRQSLRGAGTDGYRAPETYNSDVISVFSDIYSLALIFYFIWSYGCHPFGDDPDDWNSNIKKNRNRDLSQLRILAKDSVKYLLDWMLQFSPSKRPTTEQILDHPLLKKSSSKPRPEKVNGSPGNNEAGGISEGLQQMSIKDSRSSEDFIKLKAGIYDWTETKTADRQKQKLQNQQRQIPEKGQRMSEDESLQAILEEENCQSLMMECKFAQALLKLNDLIKRGRNELSTQLMMVECNLQLRREEIANKIIAGIKVNVKQHYSRHEVQVSVDEQSKNSSHIQAMIMIPCLCEKFMSSPHTIETANGVKMCIEKMREAVVALLEKGGRSLVVIHNLGLPSLHEMFNDLCRISGIPEGMHVLSKARSLNQIGACYHSLEDHVLDLKYQGQGLRLMEEYFQCEAQKYEVYGRLLHNVAIAQHSLGNYKQAESLFLRSLEVNQNTSGFENESHRQEILKKTEDSLKQTRQYLTK